ncbi:MAG: hypothetical protein DRP26_02850 [Candidatus Zixiibacteriota bacterium]|nr:MAG: hypothetical protein DRP26_02850 [candidate division Zixibacteria bacterium]
MGKCKICGKQTLEGYDLCPQCGSESQKSKKENPGKYYSQPRRKYYDKSYKEPQIPDSCVFKDGFYNEDGYIKREVFIESAEQMSDILQRKRMTQASIRHLFNMIKSIEMRLKADRDLPLGFIRENFYKFVTHTEYQVKRGIIPEVFREFVDSHKDIAVRSIDEFKGFVQYLTSIVARMKQK